MQDSEYLNHLHSYAEILEKIMNEDHMNSVCGVMLQCLRKCNLRIISPLVLKNLALTICGKISVCVNSQMPLGKNVLSLIDFLIEKNLVAKVFYSFLCDQVKEVDREILTQDKNLEDLSDSNEKINETPINAHLQDTLNRVLNICDKAEKYTNCLLYTSPSPRD